MATPTHDIDSLAQMLQNGLTSLGGSITSINTRLTTHEQQSSDGFAKLNEKIGTVLDDHTQQLATHDTRIHNVEGLVQDLQRKLTEFSSCSSARSQVSSSAENPLQGGSSFLSTLTFPESTRADIESCIAKSIELEKKNAFSIVVFHAKTHMRGMTEKQFGEEIVGLFNGQQARVTEHMWIGQGQVHLKLTLDKPRADDIASAFWKERRQYNFDYSLAPCRGRTLREAIFRMRRTIDALRHKMTELGPKLAHATSACIMGKDFFAAYKFLYPAIRLSDGRIIPISQLLNAPLAPIILETDPSFVFPTPDASFNE
jgi:hypothetical protein